MNDLHVVRTTKKGRLVRSKLKLIATHLACRLTGADEMDLGKQRDREAGGGSWLREPACKVMSL
jgi:hypothetical protein